MVIRRRSICPLRAGLRQGRSALGFAETPAALMGSVFVVAPDPLVEILLQLGDRAVDALAERHPVELVQHCFVEALDAGRGAAHPDHSAPGLGSRFSLMTPSVRSSVDYCTLMPGEFAKARFVAVVRQHFGYVPRGITPGRFLLGRTPLVPNAPIIEHCASVLIATAHIITNHR